ncbi:MAG: glucosaminidase domain-containing protein [Bryobacteraceae bacterium]
MSILKRVPDLWLRIAKALEVETDCPWQWQIAVAIHESAWGESHLAREHNNVFGIRGDGGADGYQHFQSLVSGFKDFCRRWSSRPEYAEARAIYRADGRISPAFVMAWARRYCPDSDNGGDVAKVWKRGHVHWARCVWWRYRQLMRESK